MVVVSLVKYMAEMYRLDWVDGFAVLRDRCARVGKEDWCVGVEEARRVD